MKHYAVYVAILGIATALLMNLVISGTFAVINNTLQQGLFG